jgi:hypothetical protein
MEAEFDLTGIEIPDNVIQQGFGAVRDKSPKALVRFEWRPVELKQKSLQEGRPIFEQRLFAERRIPGSRDFQPADVEVDFITNSRGQKVPDPMNRIVREYGPELKRFLEAGEKPLDGTPLEEWRQITKERIAVCHWLDIRTIEELASMENNDTVIQKLGPGGRELVAQADAFLKVRADSAYAERLAAEKEAMKRDSEAKIAQLQSQLEALAEKFESVVTKKESKAK